jgi:hypothetical protein
MGIEVLELGILSPLSCQTDVMARDDRRMSTSMVTRKKDINVMDMAEHC